MKKDMLMLLKEVSAWGKITHVVRIAAILRFLCVVYAGKLPAGTAKRNTLFVQIAVLKFI